MMAIIRCCRANHKIHPLENILDITEDDKDFQAKSDVKMTKADKSEMGKAYDTRVDPTEQPNIRSMTEITPMHAAAVNGDKSSLTKLLVANPKDIDAGDKFNRTPLMFCVLGDRMECAEVLVKAGADLNRKDMGGRTALNWAAHRGNVRFVKMLLSKGADWREKDNEGQAALHLSTRHQSAKCLALLVKQLLPGEVDDQDKNKRTALHWAASYGHVDHVKMLIKQDSNIGIPDCEGKTPLHWAASSKGLGAVHCVQVILETAPSVINWQDYDGRTALHLAVAQGNEDVVEALSGFQPAVEKCKISAMDNMFRTPLHWAAVLGHSKIVQLLLDRGADFSSTDSNNATSLHYAAQHDFDETVEVFLRKDLKDEVDMEGRTAFMWAASKGADKVIKVFIRYGVELNQVDKHGGSPLHAAAFAGHSSTVRLLLQSNANINATDLMKHTPVFRACEAGHTDVVQTLLDLKAKIDLVDTNGRSPLHWAALGGHAYICQTLIKLGIDPNVKDNSGRTPLLCASYGGFVNCMLILIENKANTNAQDSEGMTALHWGCSKGHLEAVKLLVESGAFPNNIEFTEDRYTPLDYAHMGEHQELAQYLIEQGALSITGIQDMAAVKIQSNFRGYRVRKNFKERKKLLIKHEQLKNSAAKKRDEEVKKRADTLQRLSSVEDSAVVEEHVDNSEMLERAQKEKEKKKLHRLKSAAATTIQRAWKNYLFRNGNMIKTTQNVVREKRLRAGEEEWLKQIAALTIQLAWRKYYRRKLLKSMTPNKKHILRMWDPEVVALKQQHLVERIYSEHIDVADWHPKLKSVKRPPWFKLLPSPAAVSYNFAVDQYDPIPERFQPSWSVMGLFHPKDKLHQENSGLSASHFSYNYYK